MTEHATITSYTGLDAAYLAPVLALLKKYRRVIEAPIQGGSMTPTIPNGHCIRIQCDAADTYKRGEIIAFMAGNTMVVHRIIYCGRYGRAKGYLLTQGDGMLLPDTPVPTSAVLGPVTAIQWAADWHTPACFTYASWRRRLVASMARAMLGCALSIHVILAQWLAQRLRMLPVLWHKAARLRAPYASDIR